MVSGAFATDLMALIAPLVIGGLIDRLSVGIRRLRERAGAHRAAPAATLDPAEQYRLGLEAERAGRAAAARQAFEDVVRREAAHAPAHLRLAALAAARGDRQAGLAHALQALRAGESPESMLAAADALAAADRADEARVFYRQILERDPEHLLALRRLRDTAMQAARWTEALACQDRLVRLAGTADRAAEREALAAIHQQVGSARLAQRDAAGAVSAFRDALRVQGDFVPAHVGLGDAHLLAGDAAQALKAWERGLEAAPAALPLLARIEERHHAEGRPRRMIALYERAASRAPQSLAVAVGLGRVYFELSMLDEAAEQFQKIEVRAPDLPVIHAFLGRIFEQRGLVREACEEYRRALEAGGGLAWPHHCSACGSAHVGWADRCPSCRRWNTLQA